MDDDRPGSGDLEEVARPPLPLGLWVIAILLAVGGVAILLSAIGVRDGLLTGGLMSLDRSTEGRVVIALFGSAMIVAGIGMLLRIRSAWGLAMLLIGIGLATNLVSYFVGDPNLLRLAIFVIAAFYLNQRAVHLVFAERPARRVAAR
jgi:hypothetical protein